MGSGEKEPSDLIRSVSRAFRILEEVGAAPEGLHVKQIAHRSRLSVPTTYHLVRTLRYEGYLLRRDSGRYVLGLEIASRFRDLMMTFAAPPTKAYGP
jgi:DNA-binding IclR family transcriptional regulator